MDRALPVAFLATTFLLCTCIPVVAAASSSRFLGAANKEGLASHLSILEKVDKHAEVSALQIQDDMHISYTEDTLAALVAKTQALYVAGRGMLVRPVQHVHHHCQKSYTLSSVGICWLLEQRSRWADMFTWSLWFTASFLVLISCYRAYAMKRQSKPGVLGSGNPDFAETKWYCLSDFDICVCSFLCPAIRWADTMNVTGLMPFWLAYTLFVFAALVNCFTWGLPAFGLCSPFLLIYFRWRLRLRLGSKVHETFSACPWDCFYVTCCPWCSIAQEALLVQRAFKNDAFKVPEITQ